MIWLIRQVIKDFPTWDRPTQAALALALLLLIPALLLAFTAPEAIRPYAWFGAGALLIVAQIAILWGGRGMVTAFTSAQRAYLAGDLAKTIEVLESARVRGRADMRMLTLLGNTYRQLGRLDESRACLYEAIDKAPDHPFPLIGIGRTLLSGGQYADAALVFERALAAGAPAAVQLDLAHALYRADEVEAARAALPTMETFTDAGEALVYAYLRAQLVEGQPLDRAVVEAGLSFWRDAAARFAHTPYGVALARDMQVLTQWIQEM